MVDDMKLTPNEKKKEKINPKQLQRDYVSRIDGYVEEKGLPISVFKPSNMDDDYLELPRDITEVPGRELGKYLNAITQYKQYLRSVMGVQEAYVDQAKMHYDMAFNSFYDEVSKEMNRSSETSKERVINNIPEVRELLDKFVEEKRKCKMADYALANIDDAVFLISREVSRRGQDWSDNNRNYNVR